jgi:hypothetical protein
MGLEERDPNWIFCMGSLLEAIGYRYCVVNLFWVWVPNACRIGDSLINGTPEPTHTTQSLHVVSSFLLYCKEKKKARGSTPLMPPKDSLESPFTPRPAQPPATNRVWVWCCRSTTPLTVTRHLAVAARRRAALAWERVSARHLSYRLPRWRPAEDELL